MAAVPRRRVRAWVRGIVQGVYYRLGTQREAERLGLDGWVRNLPDGRVQFEAEGSADRVAQLLAWAAAGPEAARVDDLRVEDAPASGEATGFDVRR